MQKGGKEYNIGDRLREARKRRNLSLTDVEQRTGLHFSTIARYERNERQPSLHTLRELAKVYNVSLNEFFHEPNELLSLLPPAAAEGAYLALQRPNARPLLSLLLQLDDRQIRALQQLVESFLHPMNTENNHT